MTFSVGFNTHKLIWLHTVYSKYSSHTERLLKSLNMLTIKYVFTTQLHKSNDCAGRYMLFADDIVLCNTRREQVERNLEERTRAMEERGLKISRKKTEYFGCNEHQDADIYLQGETVKRVETFTYMGSTLTKDGELDAEVTHGVQSGWKNWKRVSGVSCDRRMNVKIKGRCTEQW